jgi:thiol-disulfide isomerase/thioredoxin
MHRAISFGLMFLAGCAPDTGPAPAKPAGEAHGRAERVEWRPDMGLELIGKPAPEFAGLSDWTHSGPLTLKSLHGRPVLVRFWTTGCSLCVNTAPVLNEMDRRFRDKGLVVVGIHHPKDPESRDAAYWRAAADRLGFKFPLAQDQDWDTVNSWWMDSGPDRLFTSATFLVDREGNFRWLHHGGEFFDGEGEAGEAYRSLVAAVEKAVGEAK